VGWKQSYISKSSLSIHRSMFLPCTLLKPCLCLCLCLCCHCSVPDILYTVERETESRLARMMYCTRSSARVSTQ
jgi:hypothetical protein